MDGGPRASGVLGGHSDSGHGRMGNIFHRYYHIGAKCHATGQSKIKGREFWGGLSMWIRPGFCAVLATACMFSGNSEAQVLMQRDVSLAMALTIATTASAECGAITSIAVVDRAGRIKILMQGDGGSPHNVELARRKAYTARTFRMPSAAWAKRTETTNAGQRMLSDVIPLGGGMPIMVGDETIGAIGLSGAVGGQDKEEACAKAGIAKVADQLK
jgi:uncharacterized protein GlcG (DUF336 family)